MQRKRRQALMPTWSWPLTVATRLIQPSELAGRDPREALSVPGGQSATRCHLAGPMARVTGDTPSDSVWPLFFRVFSYLVNLSLTSFQIIEREF